jgi:hypothetical protein
MSVTQEFNARKLLYDNKDIFFELADDQEDNKFKELSDSISKGQKLLKNTLLDYNKSTIEKQNLDNVSLIAKNTYDDIQTKLDQITNICKKNNIIIEDLSESIDQVNYILLSILDNIDNVLKEKQDKLIININNDKQTLKSLSKVFNILRSTNISYTCPVCLQNQVDVFIQDCGHSMCSQCVSKAIQCFFCRSHISHISKLYFML